MSEQPSDQVPAVQPRGPATQKDRMAALLEAVRGRAPQLKTLLAATGINFDLFVEIFHRAMIKGRDDPRTDITTADAGSVIQACIDAATAGVLPDGRHAAIVLFNTNVAPRGQPKRFVKKAQFMLMFEGMLQVAYASGNFLSIQAQVVYAVDEWDYELGITPWVKHKPGRRAARGEGAAEYEIVAAYAVAKTVNGGVFLEIFEPEDIRKVMAVSRATSGPAKDWREAMIRKGPLRRLFKFIPRNPAMDRLLEVDDSSYEADVEELPTAAARKLSPGFAPPPPQPQITEGADMTVPDVEDERDLMPVDVAEASDEAENQEMRAEIAPEPAVSPDERVDPKDFDFTVTRHEFEPKEIPGVRYTEGRGVHPVDEEVPLPPGLDTFALSVKVATSWLNIKQALRTVAKHPAWQEGPQWPDFAYHAAWAKFRELEDKTDICQDLILFETWIRAADPMPMAAEANWALLQKMEVFTKAGDDVKGRLEALVKAVVGEQGE